MTSVLTETERGWKVNDPESREFMVAVSFYAPGTWYVDYYKPVAGYDVFSPPNWDFAGTTVVRRRSSVMNAKVVTGCKARNVRKGDFVAIEVAELGREYTYQVKVVLCYPGGRRVAFYARHKNRLSDPVINLNDGNPHHKIQIQKV